MLVYKLFLQTKNGTMPMYISEDEYQQITQEPVDTLDLMSLLSQGGLEEDECDCEDRDCENCHQED